MQLGMAKRLHIMRLMVTRLSLRFLPWYLDEFVRANDGSFCALELDNDSNQFERLFISFGVCVKGF